MRNLIAQFFFLTGFSKFLFHLSRIYYGNNHIRIVNYHSTPKSSLSALERQFSFFRKYYENVDLKELLEFLNDKTSQRKKPGIIISFDDGLQNNASVAVPLLERYGLTGWFCIPTEFHTIQPQEQFDYAKTHSLSITGVQKEEPPIAMSADTIKLLSEKHEIVSHTFSHVRFKRDLGEDQIKNELIKSKAILQSVTKKDISCFCWVGGELNSYSKNANKAIKRHYKLGFRTNNLPVLKGSNPFALERSNLEAWFSFPLFLLTISGFYDILYFNKRKKIKNILNE